MGGAGAGIVGLELQHEGDDLALAVMEGIAFQAAILLQEYRKNGTNPKRLRVMGGAGKSRPWMEILSAAAECETKSSCSRSWIRRLS